MRAAARGHPVRYSAKLFALHDGFWRWAGGKLARAHRFRLRLALRQGQERSISSAIAERRGHVEPISRQDACRRYRIVRELN